MTPTPVKTTGTPLLTKVEAFISKYLDVQPEYRFAAALWVAACHCWDLFDTFPYLVITSTTKRSGKTRFAEILSFMVPRPQNISGVTPAAIFRMIRDLQPVIFVDEAESLSSEAANTMRALLNVGYRKGQTIPRMGKHNTVEQWPAYCPKAFILIGDVYDTLRDRSIIAWMRRGTPRERFIRETALEEGAQLGDRLAELLGKSADHIGILREQAQKVYMAHAGLSFLPDRDEEIWLPLFAICNVLAPDRIGELQRVAVDLATEKTQEARTHSDATMKQSEEDATNSEYAERLVRDLFTVIGDRKVLFTVDALPALMALPTGPWRKFHGTGLTAIEMGSLLRLHGIAPRTVRIGGRKENNTKKGYRRDEVAKVVESLDAHREA